MAARAKTTTAKENSASLRRKTAAKPVSAKAKHTTLAQLQEECKQMRAQLEASEARVAELEALLEETINRIEWTIDLLENKTSDTH